MATDLYAITNSKIENLADIDFYETVLRKLKQKKFSFTTYLSLEDGMVTSSGDWTYDS
ncbi:MAG: hypothetical protein ITG00_09710 [Flavobacterium sp.]|nr:hypothetical protein [Flavobacterium sp.]